MIVIGNYVPDAFDECLWDKGDDSDILGDIHVMIVQWKQP